MSFPYSLFAAANAEAEVDRLDQGHGARLALGQVSGHRRMRVIRLTPKNAAGNAKSTASAACPPTSANLPTRPAAKPDNDSRRRDWCL
jgi:hypothetical protein